MTVQAVSPTHLHGIKARLCDFAMHEQCKVLRNSSIMLPAWRPIQCRAEGLVIDAQKLLHELACAAADLQQTAALRPGAAHAVSRRNG